MNILKPLILSASLIAISFQHLLTQGWEWFMAPWWAKSTPI